MEIGTIEREIHIEATPEVVYQVVSTPEHMREWWPEDAELDPVPGGTGTVTFVRPEGTHSQALTVVEADPPRRFSFRWVYDEATTSAGLLLVTFDLVPSGTGTRRGSARRASARRAGRPRSSRSSTATTSPGGTTSCRAWSRTPTGWSPRREPRRDRRRPVVGRR